MYIKNALKLISLCFCLTYAAFACWPWELQEPDQTPPTPRDFIAGMPPIPLAPDTCDHYRKFTFVVENQVAAGQRPRTTSYGNEGQVSFNDFMQEDLKQRLKKMGLNQEDYKLLLQSFGLEDDDKQEPISKTNEKKNRWITDSPPAARYIRKEPSTKHMSTNESRVAEQRHYDWHEKIEYIATAVKLGIDPRNGTPAELKAQIEKARQEGRIA